MSDMSDMRKHRLFNWSQSRTPSEPGKAGRFKIGSRDMSTCEKRWVWARAHNRACPAINE